jgi:hypothetical protein
VKVSGFQGLYLKRPLGKEFVLTNPELRMLGSKIGLRCGSLQSGNA